MAYDAQMNALIHRLGRQKGLSGEKLKAFENDLHQNPDKIPEGFMKEAADFAKYSTFMDDPGKLSQAITTLRNVGIKTESIGEVKPLVFVVPFVQTIGNLMKRGIEMVPGAGLALARGQKAADVIAKQIEGSVITAAVMYKIADGEITGQAPKEENQREAFYREGKLPWAIKMGGTWYQYRRIEPFNTAIAAAANAYDQIQNAKDGDTAATIFGNVADNFATNLFDSSYMQGLTNVLDKYGKRQGMFQRTAASFIPMSGFLRSVNRAAESATEGKVGVRDSKTLSGAVSQVIPFWHNGQPIKVDVFGQEKLIPGGAARQWSPFKLSEAKNDPVEKELARLKYFPGLPNKVSQIAGMSFPVDEKDHHDFVMTTGKEAKQYFSIAVSHPEYRAWTDKEKKDHLKSVFDDIKETYSAPMKAKAFWKAYGAATPEAQRKMLDAVNESNISDELFDALEQYKMK